MTTENNKGDVITGFINEPANYEENVGLKSNGHSAKKGHRAR